MQAFYGGDEMSGVTKEIDTYVIHYSSSANGAVVAPEIFLSKTGRYVGKITFNKGAKTEINRDRLRVNYPLSSFNDIIDILRNEKPLFLTVFSDLNKGELSTTHEPVGEGELD
ncbi:hypothetical protein KAI23_05170 [Candidatus Bathyarchaeota archaeon]|jgi:hypothetical protein|nr:hypothetical protein [Candidatus Bathyarchaeota archaeon]